MCWFNIEKPELKVADKDISVFKIATYKDDAILSYYRGFKYEEGKTYHTELGKLEEYNFGELLCCECAEGFHSYSKDHCIISGMSIINANSIILDFFPEFVSRVYQVVQLKCIIPKGSKYYLNEQGEYVSDKIKVIKAHVLVLYK